MARWGGAILGILGTSGLAAILAIGSAGPVLASQPAASTVTSPYWSMAWRSENAFPNTTKTAETCRMDALLTGAGSHVQVEFSPLVAGGSFTITRAAISFASDARLNINKSQYLSFAGRNSVTQNGTSPLRADPVTMTVSSGTMVTVTFAVSAGASPSSSEGNEPSACTTAPVSSLVTAPGSTFTTPTNPGWLGAVYVDGPSRRTIAALGDSTTSTTGTAHTNHGRWSDALTGYGATVANAGASAGQLTQLGVFYSIPGTVRADRLFNEPNITDVVMLLGENDIYAGVSPSALLTGLNQVLVDAKAHHVRAYFCTFLPRAGSLGWTSTMENERQWLNVAALRSSWLTSRGGTLIDTDALLRNPAHPAQLAPVYDSGDHAHPNAAGDLLWGKTVGKKIGLIK
jgi:lysophospholipase L1-like esterase